MRQIFLILSVLLLGLSWAVAQNTTPSTSSSPNSGQMSQGSASSGQASGRSAAGEKSVEGCLSGSGGNYTLTAKNGMTYQLTGDSSKLAEHVGHEVRVTGTMSASPAGTETAGGTAGTAGSRTLEVTSVKHISKTCKSGTGMSH